VKYDTFISQVPFREQRAIRDVAGRLITRKGRGWVSTSPFHSDLGWIGVPVTPRSGESLSESNFRRLRRTWTEKTAVSVGLWNVRADGSVPIPLGNPDEDPVNLHFSQLFRFVSVDGIAVLSEHLLIWPDVLPGMASVTQADAMRILYH